MHKNTKRFFLILALAIFSSNAAYALPMDWHGTFGADTTLIDNYRRIEQGNDRSNTGNAGSLGTQEVPLGAGNQANASWQSYIFKLSPVLIVNDAATFKGEITSGYARGGRFGDGQTQSKEPGFGNGLYPYNFSDSDNNLTLAKFYVELYADTATYQIGRHSSHYGLGAVVHSGEGKWDRFSFVRDGVTMKVRLGNFFISPFWAKIGSGDSLTRATKIKEYGFSIVYKNIERDISFGLLYVRKENSAFSNEVSTGITNNHPNTTANTSPIGKTDVKITDLYFRKAFGDLELALEVPLTSGEIGNVFGQNTKYKAKAIVFESGYKFNDSWRMDLDGGKVSGDDGGASSYEAMYLNPNYQIANLLFRYNVRAISSPVGTTNARSIYDSYITNARYLKLGGQYSTEKWTWDAAVIKAWAEKTAKAGSLAYNHSTNKQFTATQNQSDDLGTEIDLGFNYQWNNEVSIGGSIGYLFTGDYWAFSNDAAVDNKAKDTYALQLRTAIDF